MGQATPEAAVSAAAGAAGGGLGLGYPVFQPQAREVGEVAGVARDER